MATVTHATVAVGTNAGTGEIHKAEWNAGHTVVGDIPYGFIGAKIYNDGTQAIANVTSVIVLFGSEDFDTDGFHSISTNTGRFTIPTGLGGKYLLNGYLRWDTNTAGLRQTTWNKNGANIKGSVLSSTPTIGYNNSYSLSVVVDLAAGDYVELTVYQDSGSSRTLGAASGSETVSASLTRLDAGKVGAAVGARAYSNAATSTATSTFTSVGLAVENFDTDGFHSTSTNTSRMTIPAGLGGKYLLNASVDFEASASGERIVRLLLNGSGEIAWTRLDVDSAVDHTLPATTVYDLVAGDYVELQVYQTAGTLNAGVSARTHFEIVRIDALPQKAASYLTVQNAAVQTLSAAADLAVLTGTFVAGTYHVMGDYFVNGTADGAIKLYSDELAADFGFTRDGRDGGPAQVSGFYVTAGGTQTVRLKYARETGTATFGLAADPRWARNITAVRIG